MKYYTGKLLRALMCRLGILGCRILAVVGASITFLFPSVAMAQQLSSHFVPQLLQQSPRQVLRSESSRGKVNRFSLTPVLGVLIPQSQLDPSLSGGVELGYLTPGLKNRLLLSLGAEWIGPKKDGDSRCSRILSGTYQYEFSSSAISTFVAVKHLFLIKSLYRLSGFVDLGLSWVEVKTDAFVLTAMRPSMTPWPGWPRTGTCATR